MPKIMGQYDIRLRRSDPALRYFNNAPIRNGFAGASATFSRARSTQPALVDSSSFQGSGYFKTFLWLALLMPVFGCNGNYDDSENASLPHIEDYNITISGEDAYRDVAGAMGLVGEAAPLGTDDDHIYFEEALHYFAGNSEFDLDGNGMLTHEDNIPLLIRLLYVNERLRGMNINGVPSEKEARQRLDLVRRATGGVLRHVTRNSDYPIILPGERISKTRVEILVSKVIENLERDLNEDSENKIKQQALDLGRYFQRYASSTDASTLLPRNASPYATGLKDREISVSVDRTLATSLWNCFNDEEVQLLLAMGVVKEGFHVERFENGTSHFLEADDNYKAILDEHTNKGVFRGSKGDAVPIHEAIRKYVAAIIKEEFLGYEFMYKWLNEHGVDDKRLEEMALKYYGVPGLADTLASIMHYRKVAWTDGKLDIHKFAFDFVPGRKEEDVKNPGNMIESAYKAMYDFHRFIYGNTTNAKGFLNNPKYISVN